MTPHLALIHLNQYKKIKKQGSEKSRAIIAVLARVLMAPWLLFVSMLLVDEKCCWDEPEGYQAPGWKRWLAKRAKKGKERRERWLAFGSGRRGERAREASQCEA